MTLAGRIMGLDAGDVRIGVALSDPMQIIASPHRVLESSGTERDVAAIRQVAEESEVCRIVVGIPLNQYGQPGAQAEKVLAFVERLRAEVSVEVVTQDERFSTAAAQRILIDAGVRRKGRKKVVDKVAATHILQTYLDRQAYARREQP